MDFPRFFLRTAALACLLASLCGAASAQTATPFSATLQSESGALVLRWPSDSGQHYHVESSPDLTTWTAEPGDFTGTGVELTSVVRPAGAVDPTRQFWRVVAEDVPPISLALVAHRTAGVAPLSVFFDATSTTATATARPFHDLEYRWDFGDPLSGPWTEGVNAATSSKNRATGAVTAHVFERPGTYTVRLTATDGTHTATRTIDVLVHDPDSTFASTTTCVSAGTDFSGAPVGATLVTATKFDAAVSSALAAGARRILFKRGDTFTFSTTNFINASGEVLIGAFGAGARPVLRATAAGAVAVRVPAATPDVRFVDFEVDGQSLVTPCRAITSNGNNFLALRIFAHDLGYLASIGGNHASVVDCETFNVVGGSGNMPIFAADAFHFFVAGCRFDNNDGGEYNLRYQGGTYGTIAHNTLRRCGIGKSIFTLRGDSTQVTYLTRYHEIADNLFDGASAKNLNLAAAIVPQNKERNERICDVVFERNVITTSPGSGSGLMVNACDVTVRNNLVHLNGGGSGWGIYIAWSNNTGGLPIPARNRILHNTILSESTTGGVTGVALLNSGALPLDTVVMNNFVYAPYVPRNGSNFGYGPMAVYDQGTGTVISGNSTDAQAKSATPNVVGFPPAALTDWALAPGCYGLGAGAPVPVWSDFFETPLDATSPRSIGAVSN
ncbi:MAG: PKD domain-containing protein [Opitutaceae bacterium]|nr:PKD domain-containing protein [Opitutaceae bacterium]